MKKLVHTLTLCSSVLMVAACGSSSGRHSQPTEQDKLEENRLVWAAYADQSYMYTLYTSAMSSESGLSQITVIDGQVAQVSRIDQLNAPAAETTLEAIFAHIKSTIESGGSADVAYNSNYGYPETAEVRVQTGLVEGDVSYEIRDFELLTEPLANIYKNQIAWQALDYNNYTFDFAIDCDDECSLSHDANPESESGTTLVEDNSAKYTDSEEYGPGFRGNSIDYFFERMIDAERSDNFDITIDYHPTYFFPTSVTLSGRDGWADERYMLENFSLDTDELQLSALQAARTSWGNNGFYGYVMDLHISCECQPQGKIEVEVEDGTVTRAYWEEADRELTEQEIANMPLTINQLLDWAEADIQDERRETSVTYTGRGAVYPSEISSDYADPAIVDGDVYYRVEELLVSHGLASPTKTRY